MSDIELAKAHGFRVIEIGGSLTCYAGDNRQIEAFADAIRAEQKEKDVLICREGVSLDEQAWWCLEAIRRG